MALEVPAYSSLPSADHTIYLDFDGHITENYPWIGFQTIELIDSPAYSTDTDLAKI